MSLIVKCGAAVEIQIISRLGLNVLNIISLVSEITVETNKYFVPNYWIIVHSDIC